MIVRLSCFYNGNTYAWKDSLYIKKKKKKKEPQGSFWVWAQAMTAGITLWRLLSLAGPISRMIPERVGFNVKSLLMKSMDEWLHPT